MAQGAMASASTFSPGAQAPGETFFRLARS